MKLNILLIFVDFSLPHYTSASLEKLFGKASSLQPFSHSAGWTWRCEMRGPISSHKANSSPHRALLWFKDWLAPGLMGIGMNNLSHIKVEENGDSWKRKS